MHIQLIAKREVNVTGTSRYTNDLYQGIMAAGMDIQLTFPDRTAFPGIIGHGMKKSRLDFETFFASYPIHAKLQEADLFHLTGQSLATLLVFQRFHKPVIVTVQDIIPYLVRHIPELNTLRHPVDAMFYRLALSGLQRAQVIVAVSAYTRSTLIEVLKIPPERIKVVYPIVDPKKFRPHTVPKAFRARYGLDEKARYILYVGTEDPRKNLSTMILAFAKLKQVSPDVKFLKVGSAHYANERKKLMNLVKAHDLCQDVLFMNYVPDEDLPHFYNTAQAVVMPSFYEGFGLPALEAMACGTPVICARAGSLPEVVGQAGIQVDPRDAGGFADAILTLLDSPAEFAGLREAGRHRATEFSIQRTVCEMRAIYEKALSEDQQLPVVS